ncbi:MAG: TetR/AcrR family transcriptional regulator [bacterium]
MPRQSRTEEQVGAVREAILDKAIQLIFDKGYATLSMRSLAESLGITATTLYQYFKGRDEINIWLQYRGYGRLYSALKEAHDRHQAPADRFAAMVHAYLDFALSNPQYYDFLMNPRQPQYLDYVGTAYEKISTREKESSIRNFEVFCEVIGEILKSRGETNAATVHDRTVRFWSDLHGIISLYNARILAEVDTNAAGVLKRRVAEIIQSVAGSAAPMRLRRKVALREKPAEGPDVKHRTRGRVPSRSAGTRSARPEPEEAPA